jgi:hypothetical protein
MTANICDLVDDMVTLVYQTFGDDTVAQLVFHTEMLERTNRKVVIGLID